MIDDDSRWGTLHDQPVVKEGESSVGELLVPNCFPELESGHTKERTVQSAVSARQPMGIWKSSSEVAIAIGNDADGHEGADRAYSDEATLGSSGSTSRASQSMWLITT